MIVTVEAYADVPRVRIDTTAATVYRVQGGVPVQVRGEVVGGVVYDYECPQETPVTYDDGLTVSAVVEMPDVGPWLVNPGSPELSQRVVLSRHEGWVTPSMTSTVPIPGGDMIAVTMERPSESGSLTVKLWTRDEVDGFRALVADGSVLFLSTSSELGLGPGYVALGEVSWTRVGQFTGSQYRFASFPFQFVKRPAFVVSTTLTWADEVGTWAAAVGDWSTPGGA